MKMPDVLKPDVLRRTTAVPIAVCPECGAEIHVEEDVDKGELLRCDECETSLEVVGLDPIELDVSADDDDDDFYGDDDENY
jgi:lysine biosynthesis protein LysW